MKMIANESWSVTISAEDKCLYISTTDTHAGPLRISKNLLVDILSSLEAASVDGRRDHKRPAPMKRTVGAGNIVRKNGWTLSISRKEKSLVCESAHGGTQPLFLSRKELCKFGKIMRRGGTEEP
jgi:hypothetical protein